MTRHLRAEGMDDLSLYGSAEWVARTFGKSKSWFFSNRDRLEGEGFPRKDRITGTWQKADVIEWINRQRQLADRATVKADQGSGRIRLGNA